MTREEALEILREGRTMLARNVVATQGDYVRAVDAIAALSREPTLEQAWAVIERELRSRGLVHLDLGLPELPHQQAAIVVSTGDDHRKKTWTFAGGGVDLARAFDDVLRKADLPLRMDTPDMMPVEDGHALDHEVTP